MPGRSPAHHLVAHGPRRLGLILAAAVIGAAGASLVHPSPVAAAGPKVVIVVGPSDASTARYIARGKVIAAQARRYGARVFEIYTPYATWARVRRIAQGANVFVYLGHGNGSPSPYGPRNALTMNGLGLNPVSGRGRSQPVRYYGEALIARDIRFAPRAVVLLNHLCYASGNAEPGMREPTWTVARQRVENYAAGFVRAGAGAVLADAHSDLSYELGVVLGTHRSLVAAWRADPTYHDNERRFRSARLRGYHAYLDPDRPWKGFYRSLVTSPGFSTRIPARLGGWTTTDVILRGRPSTAATTRATLDRGTRLVVTGSFVRDGHGRVWAPVRTPTTKTGYVAAWLVRYTGQVVTSTTVTLRQGASTARRSLGPVPAGARVRVLGAWSDPHHRVWLKVRTGSGRVGWIAGWLTRA